MDKSTGTPPSLEEKRHFQLCNKDGNIIPVLKIVFPPLVQQFEVYERTLSHMYKSLVLVIVFWLQGLHLKSRQKCSAAIRTWLSADQSSSSTLIKS